MARVAAQKLEGNVPPSGGGSGVEKPPVMSYEQLRSKSVAQMVQEANQKTGQ